MLRLINHFQQPLPESLENDHHQIRPNSSPWLCLSPLQGGRTLSFRVHHLIWKFPVIGAPVLCCWNRFTYSDMSILPNPYHGPPAPTSPASLTLVGSALSAFCTRVLNGPGIVKSAQSLPGRGFECQKRASDAHTYEKIKMWAIHNGICTLLSRLIYPMKYSTSRPGEVAINAYITFRATI